VPLYATWNVTLSMGVPSPFSENGQVSDPRVNVPVITMGIVAPPSWPLMPPCRDSPPPQSAENAPDAAVAVWLVMVHWKFEQLEKSGSGETAEAIAEEAVTDEAVDFGCSTQVPRSDAVDDCPAVAAPPLPVGPSTVEVRSTLHAPVAARTASSELNKTRDLFITLFFCIGRDAFGRHPSITSSSSALQFE
jgi:hypothetical protein